MATDVLRDYAAYLKEEYVKIGGGKGSLYWNLTEFIEDGRVNGLFEKNGRKKMRRAFLDHSRGTIESFARSRRQEVILEELPPE